MADKKAQTLVRVGPDELATWKEAATIRGLSLNQWIVAASNKYLSSSGVEDFTKTSPSAITTVTSKRNIEEVLLAYDLALNNVPVLTGMRKWTDPVTLREELERALGESPDAS